MFYTLKTIFILIRLAEIVVCEPAAFRRDDFVQITISGDEVACKKMVVAKGIAYSAMIRITSHGNGDLKIANLDRLHVYDAHGDGDLFRNWLLTIKFADFDGDGYRDLVIYGIADYYDENGEKVLTSRPIIHLYRFNPQKREFEEFFVYAPTWYDLYDKEN